MGDSAQHTTGSISLEQARELVSLLEAGEQAQADQLFLSLKDASNEGLFNSVGRLTRQLHNSLHDFQLDPRIEQLTADELPDAQNRLQYVIQRTEDAANRTMDAVEASLPLAEKLNTNLGDIAPQWEKLMSRDIELTEFKALCHQVDTFMRQASGDSSQLQSLLTEVLMAQDFQDLTGQVIRRVIELVQEVEVSLIELLKVFGDQERARAERRQDGEAPKKSDPIGAEGPIINPEERKDVVQGQDEVDDLLSSLGF
ncbi:protein phosphatase CheZ [Aliidiomarina maris]|uniref:Protein phosphatase CheZ n=1 Tax=Aliidiomarina maris TaxID=531312 RepID=A0A327X5Y6_9GAMM|nr:protein phosphatase CheZ [Aliidiomarina maris]MBA3988850.1 protein phosphatase [Idiomarina sp.]RAK00764.1 chemotaxis protein CheZ [Aliidiomarina maris]RUO27238.1 protein phosphatase [Aliidiomarina maris]